MYHLLIFIVNLFLSLSANGSDILNLEKYKISPNWLMGCNNLQYCTAIGYPNAQENNEQEWYVSIKWSLDKKDIFFYLLQNIQKINQ